MYIHIYIFSFLYPLINNTLFLCFFFAIFPCCKTAKKSNFIHLFVQLRLVFFYLVFDLAFLVCFPRCRFMCVAVVVAVCIAICNIKWLIPKNLHSFPSEIVTYAQLFSDTSMDRNLERSFSERIRWFCSYYLICRCRRNVFPPPTKWLSLSDFSPASKCFSVYPPFEECPFQLNRTNRSKYEETVEPVQPSCHMLSVSGGDSVSNLLSDTVL